MKTTRVAKTRAMEKIRTWAARLNDDEQEEKSHFDRLPLHLQLHIREIAKEAFAREHMDRLSFRRFSKKSLRLLIALSFFAT